MADAWPWPADDALTRARRVCHEYRARLLEHAPEVCEQVDRVVASLGQTWATGVEIVDEPVLTTAEAADLLAITPRAVRLAVKRGRLLAAGQDSDGYLFHREDLFGYLARRSRRVVAEGDCSPVPCNASGTTVPAPMI